MKMFKVATISVLGLGLLSACGGPTETIPAGKYRGYDVTVSAAGSASCGALSAAEVATAVASTSALRVRSGLPGVSAKADLNRIAAQQACHMAKTGIMSHAGPSNEGPKQRAKAAGYTPRIIAENIAAGPYGLQQVLTAWEVSSAHRANTTLPPVKDFGIGLATGADGTRYWAAVYAAPMP